MQVAAVNILTDRVLKDLEEMVLGEDSTPALRAAALEAVGNLAFAPKNRGRLQGRQALMQRVLALAHESGCAQLQQQQQQQQQRRQGREVQLGQDEARVKAAAVRVLAVLGGLVGWAK